MWGSVPGNRHTYPISAIPYSKLGPENVATAHLPLCCLTNTISKFARPVELVNILAFGQAIGVPAQNAIEAGSPISCGRAAGQTVCRGGVNNASSFGVRSTSARNMAF